jgi:hypothetical protein
VIAAAVCPHPPMLVPLVAAAQEVTARAPSVEAVRWLTEQTPELLVLAGAGPDTRIYSPGSCGRFDDYGVPLAVQLPSATFMLSSWKSSPLWPLVHRDSTEPTGPVALPLALSVGAWLLAEAGWIGPTLALGLSDGLSPAAAAALGAALAEKGTRMALLVMGDGSACRTEKAPGWFDPRAEAFDAQVTAALAVGDPAPLLKVDPQLSRDLLAAGRTSWQLLAGAAGDVRPQACLHYDDAPFGVQYTVATWDFTTTENLPG